MLYVRAGSHFTPSKVTLNAVFFFFYLIVFALTASAKRLFRWLLILLEEKTLSYPSLNSISLLELADHYLSFLVQDRAKRK